MFTATLESAILHSLWPAHDDGRVVELDDLHGVMEEWLDLARASLPKELLPRVPIVGATFSREFQEYFRDDVESDAPGERTFFWGRVSVEDLVAFHGARRRVDPHQETIDLGTPLETLASPTGSVRGEINRLLAANPPATPEIVVALIDEGVRIAGRQPTDYGGRVHQLVTADVVPSLHAESVLAVLLDRLDDSRDLEHCELVSALVAEPTSAIGLRCFQHANSVEFMTAARFVGRHLRTSSQQAVVNVSLGTHVGPHDGSSPLEAYLTGLRSSGGGTCFVVAAGNEGYRHRHCELDLVAGRAEPLTLTLGSRGCTEVMVEFWWEPADPRAPITVSMLPRRPIANLQATAPLTIHGHSGQATLQTGDASIARVKRWSLVASHGTKSCMTFALTADHPSTLSGSALEIEVESSVDVRVHAWLAICNDEEGALVGGRRQGTLLMPATADGVLCVAGLDEHGRPWPRSSRGPLPPYAAAMARKAPHVAHETACSLNGKAGTSYASPRAAAAAAAVLRRAGCMLSDDALVEKLTGHPIGQPPPWDDAIGYGPVR